MAFSSSRGGAGWVHSLLALITPKHGPSKQPRKSRRRAALKEFLLANFFTIGLCLSLLLFIFVVFSYGVPKPLLSSHHSRARLSKNRKPAYRKSPASNAASGAAVDITTKDLYDKIQFLDEDGGAWKQGWKVSYKGNEWDNEKLKVFVVPHSHNDPGWKLTVEEYYDRQSRHILDTIVDTLSKDYRRKFIWEEMSYLERWWRDASETKRESFIHLVKNGQLEIVGGGWVMNDEEFFYSEVPLTMRTMGIALYTSVFGVGSFLSALLISLVEYSTTSTGGEHSWFADDMRNSRLDYYYWLLAGLGAISFIAFIIFCRLYKTRSLEVHLSCRENS